jgi:uncharacterized protein YndB with AHSA1/START domain
MRRVMLIVLGVLVGLVLVLLAVVATRPATTHVERSRVVKATPADLWPHISDLRDFPRWDPWSVRDPNEIDDFSNPSTGAGAWYTWAGNDQVGQGKMTITAVEPEKKLVEDLEFIEPFPAKAAITLTLAPAEGGTTVTWSYDSHNGLSAKAASLFIDMDKMLGPDFATGLENLSKLAEADAQAREQAEAAPADMGSAAP